LLISTRFIDKNGEKFICHLSNEDEVLTAMKINFIDEELKTETSKLGDLLECHRQSVLF